MHHRLISFSFALAAWPACQASAQTANLQGPVSGYVYRAEAGTVLPLVGVPGAAHIGPPVFKGVQFASVGPDGKWALVTKRGHSFLATGLIGAAPVESAPSGMIHNVDRVAWSRDGSFALLYSSSANLLQRVQLSGTPSADSPLDLSGWGAVTTMALEPAGQQIALGIAGTGLYRFNAGSAPALASKMPHPMWAAFDGSGNNLYVVDADQQQVWRFGSDSSASALASLTQAGGATVNPVGMAVSSDGSSLLLADSGARAVRVYDTGTGALANTIALDFTPSRFEALSSAPSFLLNGDNLNEWLLILNAQQSPGISFVPASNGGVQ
jgi:hypothetical protein